VLFRVAQESLTNVAKHARARHVQVALRKAAHGIVLTVADDGRSFREEEQASASRKRLGLVGMRERVRLVNGEFTIRPRPGKGTTVRVVVGLKSSNPVAESA
jgi:two-component system, NarL family, sensor histidine kinase DegS